MSDDQEEAETEGVLMESVTLREHLEALLDGMDKRIQERFVLQGLAIDKAEDALNLRLANMNEVREQLQTQAGTFITRDRADTRADAMAHRIEGLEKVNANLAGRLTMLGTAIGAIVIITNIAIALFLK